ncbi:zinc ribbon domain-containing protein [Sphingobacterium ginsenosidimutans]|uniref:Zinc-ribbon 15 domain-containing protein n=2 Tax=Sphingobacterium TaxID=28453 RepID=A0ABP7ZX51_9SPHI|nr:zinc ribbon domain-containing protein [Sphingobacterium sp. E70]ULT29019.1 zinc ribbon domain-containing protein [Sphingobacterium sp. E70]
MIIFGTRTKLLQNSSNAAVGTCNYCNTAGSLYAYKQVKYFHIFWIPIFPYSTEIISVCDHCKKVNYQREIDPQTLATIRSSGMPKTPVGYFSGLILIGLFFGSAAAAGISGSIKTKKYLESPATGDVYEIKRKENGKSMYTLYRVANVTTDSITFDVNDYEAEGTKGLRKLKEQRSDNYSEKITLARAEVAKMKADNQISTIERK